MDSGLILRSYRVILNQWTKWNNRSFRWLPKTSFTWCLQEICDISQIGVTFHKICPPTFIQTRLQQYSRGAFLHSAHCSFSNSISLRSVWCRRGNDSMKDLHKLFRILRNCQCKMDFWLPLGLQELLASFSGFLVKFCFLHGYAWIHWVAKSCTTTAYRWLFRDSQLSLRTLWSAVINSPKFYSSRYGFAIASSARSSCNFGPFYRSRNFGLWGKWVFTLRLPRSSRLLSVGL